MFVAWALAHDVRTDPTNVIISHHLLCVIGNGGFDTMTDPTSTDTLSILVESDASYTSRRARPQRLSADRAAGKTDTDTEDDR